MIYCTVHIPWTSLTPMSWPLVWGDKFWMYFDGYWFAGRATTIFCVGGNHAWYNMLKSHSHRKPKNDNTTSKQLRILQNKQLHYFSQTATLPQKGYATAEKTTHTSTQQHHLKTTQLPQNNYTPQRDYQKDHTYLNKTTLPQIGFTTSNRLHYLKKTTLPQDVVYLSEVV